MIGYAKLAAIALIALREWKALPKEVRDELVGEAARVSRLLAEMGVSTGRSARSHGAATGARRRPVSQIASELREATSVLSRHARDHGPGIFERNAPRTLNLGMRAGRGVKRLRNRSG
jgi:hypothetical protein